MEEKTKLTFLFSEAQWLMLFAGLCFSLAGVAIKWIGDMSFIQVVFFRALFSLLVAYALVRKAGLHPLGNRKAWLFLRGLCGAIGLSAYIYSVQEIPLATAATIHYLAPIFTTIISAVVLREAASFYQYLSLALAFAGVLFIQGFDARVESGVVVVAVFGALSAACAYNIVRALRHSEHPYVVILSFPLVTCILTFPVLLFDFQWPSPRQWALLVLLGLITSTAQLALTKAFQMDVAARITKFSYSGLVFASLFGVFLFGEALTIGTGLGMLCVFIALFIGNKKKA